MVTLKIDNRPVSVPDGSTVLDAARALGIDVPALCHHEGYEPNTSCLCCVVRVNNGKRLVPSCATRAADGMSVESESSEIRAARKMALELLLVDHAGDCRAPCQNVCPAKMDIPTMIRQINDGALHEALLTVKRHIALPAVLGRICPELCEKGCRRGQIDAPLSICRLKRYVADVDLASGNPWLPACRERDAKRVAIVGTGPAGLAAAWYLLQFGHDCVLFDDHDEPGGNLRYAVDPAKLPHEVLDQEIDLVRRLGARFETRTRIGETTSLAELRQQFDAVLLAVGEIDAKKAAALGVPMLGKGLKADKKTMLTPEAGVFAAGAAVTPYRHAVRGVADGRAAAMSIDGFLRGITVEGEPQFTVRLGVLSEAELAVFQSDASRDGRSASSQAGEGLSDACAGAESARCLHCECAKLNDCSLRKYSIDYDASVSEFKMERRPMVRAGGHPSVVYEPGKCISCGICVQIASRAGEPLGLTFVGRGFDVRVGVPFSGELDAALRAAAAECAAACPTGALALRRPSRIE